MKMKRMISLLLLVVMIFSMMDASLLKISASTAETRYSVKHLQNGNFEENKENYKFSANYVQPDKSKVPYWDTTAYENKFEFFKGGSAHFNQSPWQYRNVAEGEVAAELNADEISTIYQRIQTVAGSTYTWGLDHRGRDTTDRMVLIIGPEQKDSNGQPIDPSKTSKNGQDQFVRITNWLKNQYGVEYPEIGCSKKYTVYSKPFAAAGKFDNEVSDEDQNISLVETAEINQEWSVWVISSPYCNTSGEHTVNGWSQYGTNASDDFDDIMKGAGSSLGYDCTYTVPNGQTETLFAFCSYSSGRLHGTTVIPAPTYGNLLDDINFELYQPFSTSSSEGGQGDAVDNTGEKSSNITITSDKPLHTVVEDGEYCTIYTSRYDQENGLKECTFQGAYVTVNNPDGTSITRFVRIYNEKEDGEITDDNKEELSKEYFLFDEAVQEGQPQRYYFSISVESPVSVHLIYAKAPFVLYDANGGQDYYFSPNNSIGGNLVGFGPEFVQILDRVDDNGQPVYVDTSEYYKNAERTEDDPDDITSGYYYSHAALPNEKWETNEDGTSPHRFCGWSVLDKDKKLVILDGEHIITYAPASEVGSGNVSIKNKNSEEGAISDLLLDASHGITLTALWKFVNRAYAQTYNITSRQFENSAVGGTVEETMIPDDLRASDVKEYTKDINGENRVECVDAFGNVGDKIMFKAIPDSENEYMFVGWYYREKQEDGTYQEVLRSTSTSIAVTVEEGKLNTYYARFQKMTAPVIFHYTESGYPANYDYYDKSAVDQYGKYFQEVSIGDTAVKPTGDSKSVKTWYTSPTERGSEYIYDFSQEITSTDAIHLYAGPTFTYNYFNFFVFQEPWRTNTYGTLKFNGKYIDLKNDADVSDYNVYVLKGTLGESAPSPSVIKSNANTIKVGKSVNNAKLLFNTVTNTGYTFNRAGTAYDDFYIFNMKTPVWVVFDFTYKGVTYTSTVKDRSLYNDITTYMAEAANGFYTTFPEETQAGLRSAQTTLLNSIQGMYNAVAPFNISNPSSYAEASSVSGLEYKSELTNPYTFTSTTAIRNIEPWGLKYSFTVDGNTVTDFADYGAVVLTDKDGSFQEQRISIENLLNHENAVMYTKSNQNVYSDNNGAIEVYYINNLLASDFNKTTYAVFFVKDANGNFYYSDIVQNTYNDLADKDTSEYQKVSQSIKVYSNALTKYLDLVEQAKNNG